MTVHLIRHGMTEANEKRLYCGITDIPLSETGVVQLRELKMRIDYPQADIYVSSGLLRANQTIAVLYGNQNVEIVSDLREIDFGTFEMRCYNDLRHDPHYQNWINDIENAAPPNGESKPVFKARVIKGINEVLLLCAAQNAAVITHGGVIAVIMDALFPGEKGFYDWQPPCGLGYSVRFSDDTPVDYDALPPTFVS